MCIGMPMQVRAVRPGQATVAGRGEQREVSTVLVGEVAVGEWLLVFLDSARERLTPERAAEVAAALDLVDDAMALLTGQTAQRADAGASPGFDLPSAMSAEQLAALTGARR